MQTVTLPESLRSKVNLILSEGLLVVHVEINSPAEKAGVLLGDVLVELEGKAVADTDGVQEVLRSKQIGLDVDAVFILAAPPFNTKFRLQPPPAPYSSS